VHRLRRLAPATGMASWGWRVGGGDGGTWADGLARAVTSQFTGVSRHCAPICSAADGPPIHAHI
jgi:hypothetical protein